MKFVIWFCDEEKYGKKFTVSEFDPTVNYDYYILPKTLAYALTVNATSAEQAMLNFLSNINLWESMDYIPVTPCNSEEEEFAFYTHETARIERKLKSYQIKPETWNQFIADYSSSIDD